jgi:GDPmannose 4,6-dehydratase
MFISNGILFNHESPRRGSNFVTSKIVKGAVAIKEGKQKYLSLGNLNATRDWGHAKDVCSTGVSHSVRDCVQYVFNQLDLDVSEHVKVDPRYFRPEELTDLKGDSTKLRTQLGWTPDYTFENLLDEMIEHEYTGSYVDVPYDVMR